MKSLFGSTSVICPSKPPPRKIELAPVEIRDFVYRKLIELAPASGSKEITDGLKGLKTRKIIDFENYGSLPQNMSERTVIARKIRNLINQLFPDYTRQKKSGLTSVPGFWLEKDGSSRLWLNKDYSCPLMLIPYRNQKGLIEACQIRFMGDLRNPVRYVWLSTPDKSNGLSCGSPLHFASFDYFNYGKPVLITEGALKAETAQIFNRDFNVIASAGITCSHDLLVAATHSRRVFIAFDTDYYENDFVARAMGKLINLIISRNKNRDRNEIKILTWNSKIKGIDEALLQNEAIICQSPQEWYRSLSEKCQYEIAQIIPTSFSSGF